MASYSHEMRIRDIEAANENEAACWPSELSAGLERLDAEMLRCWTAHTITAEREACAKICEANIFSRSNDAESAAAERLAGLIRERSNVVGRANGVTTINEGDGACSVSPAPEGRRWR